MVKSIDFFHKVCYNESVMVRNPPGWVAIGKTDARYRRCDELIHVALCKSLKDRRLGISTGEICRLAQIARPTFYAHHKNVDAALQEYEAALHESLQRRLPATRSRDVIFTILLSYIRENRGYFNATVPNANYWLLKEILESLRSSLASAQINDQVYDTYIHQQITIIVGWVKFEHCSIKTLPSYVKKLLITRMRRL